MSTKVIHSAVRLKNLISPTFPYKYALVKVKRLWLSYLQIFNLAISVKEEFFGAFYSLQLRRFKDMQK